EKLKNEVSSLLSSKDTWRYSQGDSKLEKLLSDSKKCGDRSGLGYVNTIPHKQKNSPPKFVKGESSNSKEKNITQSFVKTTKTFQKPRSSYVNFKNRNRNPLVEKKLIYSRSS
ncbi:hypothetical protein PJI17_30740, partial [Mycobacterium kansasii]